MKAFKAHAFQQLLNPSQTLQSTITSLETSPRPIVFFKDRLLNILKTMAQNSNVASNGEYVGSVDHLVLLAHCFGWFYHLKKFQSTIELWEINCADIEQEQQQQQHQSNGDLKDPRHMIEDSLYSQLVSGLRRVAQHFNLVALNHSNTQVINVREGYADPTLLQFSETPHVLGAGGFGIVFEGVYDGKRVAIKVSSSHNFQESEQEMKQEVAMLLNIQPCPHVVETLGLVHFPPDTCSIKYYRHSSISSSLSSDFMELPLANRHGIILELSGDSLQTLINKTRLLHSQTTNSNSQNSSHQQTPLSASAPIPIPWRWRVKILIDIATSISFLHACGLLHLDLKPGNILIDRFYNARLCDFGAAAPIATVNGNTDLNSLGSSSGYQLCFTPGYAPPNFGLPGTTITTRNDLYAFGQIVKDISFTTSADSNTRTQIPPPLHVLALACQREDTELSADKVAHLLTDMYDDFDVWDREFPGPVKLSNVGLLPSYTEMQSELAAKTKAVKNTSKSSRESTVRTKMLDVPSFSKQKQDKPLATNTAPSLSLPTPVDLLNSLEFGISDISLIDTMNIVTVAPTVVGPIEQVEKNRDGKRDSARDALGGGGGLSTHLGIMGLDSCTIHEAANRGMDNALLLNRCINS
jgi:serine/threonine protein kinase